MLRRPEPARLRRDLHDDGSPELNLRRGVVTSSLLGMASMAIVSLYQTGILRRLPDPPLESFDSDKVNASDTAYGYGAPDGTITLAAHAVNLALAAAGTADRAREQPWLPILASGLAGAQAAVAAKYLFYQMPKVERAWCGYCITDALTHLATFALTVPEAAKAVAHLRRSRGAA